MSETLDFEKTFYILAIAVGILVFQFPGVIAFSFCGIPFTFRSGILFALLGVAASLIVVKLIFGYAIF